MKNVKFFEKEIMHQAMLGNENLQKVESNGITFLMIRQNEYYVDGYVFDEDGYQSKFKQAKIQRNKDCEVYIMANRKKFVLSEAEKVQYDKDKLHKELETAKSMKKTFESIQAEDGDDMSTAIANQDFYIKNLTKLIEAINVEEDFVEDWKKEIPSDVYPLIEDVEDYDLKFVIEQCDWILEQAEGDTFYAEDGDEGVEEVRQYAKKYRKLSEAERHENKIGLIVQEAAEIMNEYDEGHIDIEVARDVDEDKVFYIADINIHGYVEKGDGITDTERRSIEVGYSSEKEDAYNMARKAWSAMKKVSVTFEVNDDLFETEY